MFSKMKGRVEKAIKNIRPSLQADGGDVKLVEITENGVVKVRLTGACSGCMMSQVTLKYGIERYLKQRIPEVKKVEAVLQK
jgi:Fe-S cluster biogenesis protein NfuA